jgi:hypothetical protein
MRNFSSIAEGSELKYDKHELRLLACAPLPPVMEMWTMKMKSLQSSLRPMLIISRRPLCYMALIIIYGFFASVQIVLL